MELDARQFSADKILKHLDRVNLWLQDKNPPPITVEFDLTNVCNQRCPECSGTFFQNRNGERLSRSMAEGIIRQLKGAEVRGLIFTGGGEPLCHPDSMGILAYAKNLGHDIGFITNGTLIDERVARTLLGCSRWIRISADAASAETFKRTHGMDGTAFVEVLNNLKLLVAIKKKAKSKATIGVGFLTCDYTSGEMLDAAKLYKRLGVDYLQFRPMQIHNGGQFVYHRSNLCSEISACLKESTREYRVLCSQHKYEMMLDKDYGRNYKKCYGHQFATVVAANGKMYICCHMRGNDKYCIGDLHKNTFMEIWNSKRRKRVAEGIDFKDCVPLCRDNTFNQVLWNIKWPREHINFL